MLVTWKYRPRNSVIEQFDPRARWIASFLILFGLTQFWDIRFLLFFFVLMITQFLLTKLKWEEVKRPVIFILILVLGIIAISTLLTGRGGNQEVISGEGHIIWRVEWVFLGINIHPTITVERVWFAMSQIVRMLSISGFFLIVPYTMNPRHYGITFGGMGLPDRAAFTMDLAFRFVPSLARDFGVTLDAQRARGYEMDKLEGGLVAQIRKMAPLVIPITMNAILSGEDITNAMDLRCFGLQKRTWVYELHYRNRDYVLMAAAALILISSLLLRHVVGIGWDPWVPAWALTWGHLP